MSTRDKLLASIRNNPRNVRFADLVALLAGHGFTKARQNGSHQIFAHPRFPGTVTIQEGPNGTAKGYQVRQALAAIETIG